MKLNECEISEQVANHAVNAKASNVLLFDVKDKSTISDYIVICQGRSQAHVKGIADYILQMARTKSRIKIKAIEGKEEGAWVLLDFNVLIVHIFFPEMREYYKLEEHYQDCKKISFEDLD